MTIAIVLVITGLVLLAWGADRFVFGAAATARNLGVSPLVVGLTIVGFGTSAPELLVSAMAAWNGSPGLAIGNAVGSNIANVGLVLGLAAVLSPMVIASRILTREFPVMLATLLLPFGLLWDGNLSRMDGLVLCGALVAVLGWMVHTGLRGHKPAAGAASDELDQEFAAELRRVPGMWHAVLWLVVGLAVLLGSSRMLVAGAVDIAQFLGVSDLLIGLTVVAIGTSLPEVATSVASTMKNEDDIAFGNIIGSNMFNMLGVIGVAGVITPATPPPELLLRDFPVMFAMVLVMLAAGYRRGGPLRYNRVTGLLLLGGFVAYLAWLGTHLPR